MFPANALSGHVDLTSLGELGGTLRGLGVYDEEFRVERLGFPREIIFFSDELRVTTSSVRMHCSIFVVRNQFCKARARPEGKRCDTAHGR